MTRINVGIPPAELTGKHLIAEHREIKRIPNKIKKGKYSLDNQPKEFKLGLGHVKFFYDKIGYLKRRYETIYNECLNRGYNVTNYSECFEGIKPELMNDYKPTQSDIEIIKQRIKERLNGK
jgi:deoxyribonuclease (pyrimidine dimer)